jgi:hypothetical protein
VEVGARVISGELGQDDRVNQMTIVNLEREKTKPSKNEYFNSLANIKLEISF